MFSSYKVSFYKKMSQNVSVQVNFYIIVMEIEDSFFFGFLNFSFLSSETGFTRHFCLIVLNCQLSLLITFS